MQLLNQKALWVGLVTLIAATNIGVSGQPVMSHQSVSVYTPGSSLTITNGFVYSGQLWSLLWRPQLPAGWTLGSVCGDGNPEMSGGEILWTGTLPPSPIRMVYTVLAPDWATGIQQIRGEVEYQLAGMVNPATGFADPNPLTVDAQGGPPVGTVQVNHLSSAQNKAGTMLSVTNTFTFTNALWSLLWRPQLPSGWTLGSVSGDGNPEMSSGEILWTGTLPPSPIRMIYAVQVPVGAAGAQQIRGEVEYQLAGMVNPATRFADPNPLTVDAQGGLPVGTVQVTHLSSTQYVAGAPLSVTNTFTFTNALWSLLWRPQLPDGWSLISVSGDGSPEMSRGEILWTGTLPASPIRMVYTVLVPAGATGTQQIRGEVEYQLAGMVNPAARFADPNPMIVDSPPDLTNRAPVLSVPPNQTINELSTLTVTNTATDADLPANTLTFSLVFGPVGMSVNPITGVLTWTPTEAQGPSTNVITVKVVDNGVPPLSDAKSFTVVVREVNATPVLTVPANQTVMALNTLLVTNIATDSDLPANSLTFSLVSGPSGVSVHPTTGVLSWTPTEAQAPSTNVLTVQVTDNGVPSLSDTKSFTVVVNSAGVKPSITKQPSSQTVAAGTNVTFFVTATGTAPLAYQWHKNGTNLVNGGRISGATATFLTITNVQAADAGNYSVVVSNSVGSATSQVATLNLGMPPGTVRWEFTTGDMVYSSPAIGADGTVYVGSYDRKVYALDGATGAKRWEFATGDYVWCSQAIGDDGTVYVTSKDGKVYALDGATGTKRWEFASGNFIRSTPAIGADGTMFVSSGDGKVYALNGATGAKRWEFATGGSVSSSPAIGADGTVYVGSFDRKVYALDGTTGAKHWEFATGGEVLSSPAIGADGTIYVGSHDRKVYALEGTTGSKLWEFATGGEVLSSPAIGIDGTVYVGSEDQKVYALDGATGATRWEFATGGRVHLSSPAVGADGTVYVGSWDGKVYALASTSGAKRWEFATGGQVVSSPALGSDGTLYVGSADGKYYALYSSSAGGPANSPWPMFHQNARRTGRAETGSTTAPTISAQPQNQTVAAGANVTFTVTATGTAPLSYQWRKDGVSLTDGGRISGARAASLTISNVRAADAGEYTVLVSNPAGSVTSRPATLALVALGAPVLTGKGLANGFRLEWLSQAGIPSQPQRSTNLVEWIDVGNLYPGTGGVLFYEYLWPAGQPEQAMFFRLRVP